MKITKTTWAMAAARLVGVMDARHPPYTRIKDLEKRLAYTRKPAGAWVPVWVWVPKEMAQLEKTT